MMLFRNVAHPIELDILLSIAARHLRQSEITIGLFSKIELDRVPHAKRRILKLVPPFKVANLQDP